MTTDTKEFSSLTAIARFLKDTPASEACANSSIKGATSHKWDLGLGFDGALDMAARGGLWPKGAENLMEAHVETTSVKDGHVSAEDYDVVGHTLDIGTFLAGAPDCYINEGDEDEDRKPIIKIGVQCGRSYNVKAQSIMYRGAAILSAVDDLEDQGYRVEIWALWQNLNSGGSVDYRTLIKEAHDHWNPSAVAFALCHPAFNRRLMFAVAETNSELAAFTQGYGRGHSGHAKEFDVFIPYQTNQFDNAEHAMMQIMREFNNQLEIKEQAA